MKIALIVLAGLLGLVLIEPLFLTAYYIVGFYLGLPALFITIGYQIGKRNK